MSRLEWASPGERSYEQGVDRAVLYVDGVDGVAWNGILSIIEQPTGGENRTVFIDGIKIVNTIAKEYFGGTITAFYSPPEFDICDGGFALNDSVIAYQQKRKAFGFSFRTLVDGGPRYKIHLVYNALAAPSPSAHRTIAEETEIEPLSWAFTSTPVLYPGFERTSHIVIDSEEVDPWVLEQLEDILYGTPSTPPWLPYPSDLEDLYVEAPDTLIVTDHGDGSFTVEGPNEAIQTFGDGIFQVTWPTAIELDPVTYQISSS